MGSFEYHRPGTLEEAVQLLGKAVPLAGGTHLNASAGRVPAVVDLRDLDLDWIRAGERQVTFGAMCTVQAMMETKAPLPAALRACCRLEAGWNLRNAATLGGTIAAGTSRSPLLTALLAAGTEITLQPGPRTISLDEYLSVRGMGAGVALITEIAVPIPRAMQYEGVARAPADSPIVCAAVAAAEVAGETQLRASLGGWGERPILVGWLPWEGAQRSGLRTLAEAGGRKYAQAADQWASGAYRGRVAETLLERLLLKVVGA